MIDICDLNPKGTTGSCCGYPFECEECEENPNRRINMIQEKLVNLLNKLIDKTEILIERGTTAQIKDLSRSIQGISESIYLLRRS